MPTSFGSQDCLKIVGNPVSEALDFFGVQHVSESSKSLFETKLLQEPQVTVMIGNRVTEKDLRDWLTKEGFAGKLAKLNELELHAIRPPGWFQVFRFSVELRPKNDHDGEQPRQTHWGIIIDDERKPASQRTTIRMFVKQQEQLRALSDLPSDLIQVRNRQAGGSTDYRLAAGLLLTLVAGSLFFAFALQWVGDSFAIWVEQGSTP